MKLDHELIRKLLVEIEEKADGNKGIVNIEVLGYTQTEIKYHLDLLLDAPSNVSSFYCHFERSREIYLSRDLCACFTRSR